MQKWEYLRALAILEEDWGIAFISGQEFIRDVEKRELLDDFLTRIGNEGWELCTDTYSEYPLERNYYTFNIWMNMAVKVDDEEIHVSDYLNELFQKGWEIDCVISPTPIQIAGAYNNPLFVMKKIS